MPLTEEHVAQLGDIEVDDFGMIVDDNATTVIQTEAHGGPPVRLAHSIAGAVGDTGDARARAQSEASDGEGREAVWF